MADALDIYHLVLRLCSVGLVIDTAEKLARRRSFGDAGLYCWAVLRHRYEGAPVPVRRLADLLCAGADRRAYPPGDVLAPEDANVVDSYGKKSDALGPDEVGSHPKSRSPFGIDDLAGNVWEWVADQAGNPVARGGSFHFPATTARIANREAPVPEYRDISLGLRVCSSVPHVRLDSHGISE